MVIVSGTSNTMRGGGGRPRLGWVPYHNSHLIGEPLKGKPTFCNIMAIEILSLQLQCKYKRSIDKPIDPFIILVQYVMDR